MDTLKVSGLAIAIMIIVAIFAFALPLVTYFILRKKMKARFVPVIIGAATFVIAALVIERFVHELVLGNPDILAYMVKNPIIFGIYGGLMAGLFEESGRFGAFKLMGKRYNSSADALSYGIGHGGVEVIILLGFTMINSVYLSIIFNSGTISSAVPEAQLQVTVNSLMSISAQPASLLIGAVERIGAFTFHVGASILVYLAASKRASFWFYPLAILLHMVLDLPAAFFQAGMFNSIWLMEGYLIVFSGLTLWFAISRLRSADRLLMEAQLQCSKQVAN